MRFKLVEDLNTNYLESIFDVSFNDFPMRKLDEATLNRVVNKHDEDGYVIISASRSKQKKQNGNEMNSQEIADSNNVKTRHLKMSLHGDGSFLDDKNRYNLSNEEEKELRTAIEKMHYSYLPVFGAYKEENSDKFSTEKSFIVFPYDNVTKERIDFSTFENDMITLGDNKVFAQDAILIKQPNRYPQYYDCKNRGWIGKPFTGKVLNDVQQEYFTSLKKWNDMEVNPSARKKDNFAVGKPQRFSYVETYINPFPCSMSESSHRYYNRELF